VFEIQEKPNHFSILKPNMGFGVSEPIWQAQIKIAHFQGKAAD